MKVQILSFNKYVSILHLKRNFVHLMPILSGKNNDCRTRQQKINDALFDGKLNKTHLLPSPSEVSSDWAKSVKISLDKKIYNMENNLNYGIIKSPTSLFVCVVLYFNQYEPLCPLAIIYNFYPYFKYEMLNNLKVTRELLNEWEKNNIIIKNK